MKKLIKGSKESLLLSFVFSFMLFIYEPLCMYASNMDDFYFDIYSFFPFALLEFLFSFIVLSIGFILIRKFKKNIYRVLYVIFFILFFCMYIEGNYLCAFLPVLDGTPISWRALIVPIIISTVLWIAVAVTMLVLTRKFKFKKIKKYTAYASLLIFAMLLCSSISFFTKPNFFEHRSYVITTQKNVNNISKDKNFIIFVLDSVNAKEYREELKNLNKEGMLDGFTYYEDTLSMYPYTKFAIPHMLSNTKFEGNGESYQKYYSDGIDNSKLLKRLENEGYELDIYEQEFVYNNDNIDRIANLYTGAKIYKKELLKQQIKYTMFRYAPYVLKKFAKIETFTLDNMLIMKNTEERFYSFNRWNYQYYLPLDFDIVDNKKFMFYHLEGSHVPFDLDVDLNVIENNTSIYKKIDATITITNAFLDKLKRSGQYDNTAIVILADHGYDTGLGRQNPLLMIKGFDERHDLVYSDKKVSFEDLYDIYMDLLDNKKSSELIPNERKERYYYSYKYANCDIYEKVTTGHAQDKDKLVKTGKVYKCT